MIGEISSQTRRAIQAVVLAVVLVGTAACGAAGQGAGPVTIRFVSYNYGTPDLGGQGVQGLIDQFQASHPDIRVEAEGATAEQIYPKVQAETAAGDPPDIAQIGWSKLAAAARTLPVTPVDQLAAPNEVAAQLAGIAPQALAAGRIGGQQVAMPFLISTPTLFINADLFRRAGLDPARPPRTWDEVQQAGLAIARTTGAQGVSVAAANAAKSDFLTQSLVNGNGGQLLSPEGRAQLSSPQGIGALTMLAQLTNSGAAPKIADNDAVAAFKGGKLGMYVTSTALLASFQKAAAGAFTIRTAPMPQFGDAPAHPTYSGAALMVLSGDDAHRRAAWQFLSFLTSKQGYTTVTQKIGYLPLRPDIVDDPAFLGPTFAADPSLRPALAQLANVAPYQSMPGPRSDQARQTVQDEAVAPIMLNGADPAATAARVNDKVNQLLGTP